MVLRFLLDLSMCPWLCCDLVLSYTDVYTDVYIYILYIEFMDIIYIYIHYLNMYAHDSHEMSLFFDRFFDHEIPKPR